MELPSSALSLSSVFLKVDPTKNAVVLGAKKSEAQNQVVYYSCFLHPDLYFGAILEQAHFSTIAGSFLT